MQNSLQNRRGEQQLTLFAATSFAQRGNQCDKQHFGGRQ
jgi:hypothetical protein